MSRTFLVAQREFLENLRTRGFWIGILMLPIMLAMVAAIPLVVESTREVKRFSVLDRSGWLLPVIQQQIEAQDFAYFLENIRDYAAVERLPRAFSELNGVVIGLSEEQIHALAFRTMTTLQFSADYDHVQLPEGALDFLDQYGVQMANWWHSLNPEDRALYSPRISSNRFQLIPQETTDPVELNRQIQEDRLFAYFIIGEHPVEGSTGSRYVSNNLTDRDLLNWFGEIVSRHIRKERLRQEDLTAEAAAWINEPLEFEGVQISGTGIEEQVRTQDVVRQWTPVAFVYLLWISVLINTQMLLTNTIEEKSNKLIEVLLSSLSPLQLMTGKIVGIAATGLSIILAWSMMGVAFFVVLPDLVGLQLPVDIVAFAGEFRFLGSFVIYFLLGYLLYAAILVGLGSICSNLKEAQNLLLPVQLVQMVPIFVMVPVGRDPNGSLAQVLSYFPPLTPFVMMNRAAGPPSLTEYAVTTVLMIVSIAAALWLAAKVFRIGILLSGKPPSVMEVLRWFRAPVTNPA